MMLTGRVFQEGPFWGGFCAALRVSTCGDSYEHAKLMLADAIEVKFDRPGLKIAVAGDGEVVSIQATRPDLLVAILLKSNRYRRQLSPGQAAGRVAGLTVDDIYDFEDAIREPTVSEFLDLLSVVAPEMKLQVTQLDLTSPGGRELRRQHDQLEVAR